MSNVGWPVKRWLPVRYIKQGGAGDYESVDHPTFCGVSEDEELWMRTELPSGEIVVSRSGVSEWSIEEHDGRTWSAVVLLPAAPRGAHPAAWPIVWRGHARDELDAASGRIP